MIHPASNLKKMSASVLWASWVLAASKAVAFVMFLRVDYRRLRSTRGLIVRRSCRVPLTASFTQSLSDS
jgi:hypothetical protein